MRVILVMVQSINGKITLGDDSDIKKWTSPEDGDFFSDILKKHTLIVMGSSTYEAAKSKMKLSPRQLRIVLSRSPEKYKDSEVAGQLEFRKSSPDELVREMNQKGYKTMLLVGGGETNKVFFEDDLVDEIYLTVEPRIFGAGKPVVAEGKYQIALKLASSKILNAGGSMLLHYLIEHKLH